MKRISLIVTTYNWPEALRLCLQSVAAQKQLPLEVIIADDGSDETTRQMIHEIQQDFPVPLIHVWQADVGFRLSLIRNKGTAAANGDYLVFIDGDVILHPYFIKDHHQIAKAECFVRGFRVLLNKKCTEARIGERDSSISFSGKDILGGKRRMHRRPFLNRLRARHYDREHKDTHCVGCNMAVWKVDFIAINGFDNKYVGWGEEDNDFFLRLSRYGLKPKVLKRCGLMYHLWHSERSRDMLEVNSSLLNKCKQRSDFRCQNGFDEVIR